MANNEPANTFDSNTPDTSTNVNQTQSAVIGSVSDSGGAFTNAQMIGAFPTAMEGNLALGTGRTYLYNGTAWLYFSTTNCA